MKKTYIVQEAWAFMGKLYTPNSEVELTEEEAKLFISHGVKLVAKDSNDD